MNTTELKNLISEKDAWEELRKAVNGYKNEFSNKTGLEFKNIDDEREDGSWWYVFKIGDKNYKCYAAYYSQEGASLETYDLNDFYEVEYKTITLQDWVEVNG